MALPIQQTYAPQSVYDTHQYLGNRGLQKNHQSYAESVIQTYWMNRDLTVQNQNYAENVDPQHAQFYKEDLQQHAQIDRAEDIQQYTTYQEVKQEEQPPLKHTTQDHVCDICDRKLKSEKRFPAHYARHIEEAHICQVCHKSFQYKSHLLRHYKIHTLYKPYVCEVCNRGFSEKCNLKVHRLLHTGQKPHVCHICQRRFTLKKNLKEHYFFHTHSGTSYICEICNNCFFQQWKLRRHYRVHSKDWEGKWEREKSEIPSEKAEEQKNLIIEVGMEEQQEVDIGQQATYVQTESDHCDIITYVESSNSQEQTLMHNLLQLYFENAQVFAVINQALDACNPPGCEH